MPFRVFNAPVPVQATETRTITDESQPGDELTITLKVPAGALGKMEISVKAEDLRDTYVTNAQDNKIIVPGMGIIPITATGCAVIARLMTMHAPTEELPIQPFAWWAAMTLTYPNAFVDLARWSADLLYGKAAETPEQAAKNDSADGMASVSGQPSANVPSTTPPSS